MEIRRTSFGKDTVLVKSGSTLSLAYLILKGKVVLYKGGRSNENMYSVLSEGDFLALESIMEDKIPDYSAVSDTEVIALVFQREHFHKGFDNLPPELLNWLRTNVSQKHHTLNQGVSIKTVYSLCNTLYAFMRLNDLGSQQESLKGPLNQIAEELAKTLTCSRYQSTRLLNALSEVGLLDLREGDPMHPIVLMPNQKLFLAYLDYLQKQADLPLGMHDNLLKLNIISLSIDAGKLLDGLLTEPDLVDRMFEPERAIVHLSQEKLNALFVRNGGKAPLDPQNPCMNELELHGVFTRIVDNQQQSVFANIRNMMRLNMLRDPENNFGDITEYLCDRLASK